MQRKNTTIWIVFIIAPIALIIISSFLQIIFRAAGLDGGATTLVNLFSLLVGMIAVLGILGLPAWITLLVIAINHNKKIDNLANPVNQQNPNPQPINPQAVYPQTQQSSPQPTEQQTTEQINQQ